jgi:hypothetical protein
MCNDERRLVWTKIRHVGHDMSMVFYGARPSQFCAKSDNILWPVDVWGRPRSFTPAVEPLIQQQHIVWAVRVWTRDGGLHRL